jgi:hypothetical protein
MSRIIKSRRMTWAGLVARIRENRNVYRLLVGKPEGKRPLVRPRSKWIDNNKMDILKIGLGVVASRVVLSYTELVCPRVNYTDYLSTKFSANVCG